jgi:glycosyltransferase involved in cell wall biosynthesis
MTASLVSVIMPVYNAERFIAQAINSVKAQAYSNLELIVIDDGSTDNSPEIARAMGDVVVYQQPQNLGVATARNRGLEVARGELIAFLDADDLWVNHKLELQVLALQAHPDLIGVGCYLQRFQDDPATGLILETFLPQLGTVLLKREVFTRVGGFDQNLILGEDFDWFLRLRDNQEAFALIPQVLLKYRMHDKNTSASKSEVAFWSLKVMRQRMLRFAGKPPRLTDIPLLEVS